LRDRYVLERELGRGGMATVYLARDLKHGRVVAVKVLRPELSALLGPERFLREIRVTAGLQHPHILPLLDSGEAGGSLYYVMPYVEGESLRQRLEREEQLPLPDTLRIARAVASALEYAHKQGIIHRDIKPENILLYQGEAMLADFGIALAAASAGPERLTETGLSLGTPAYMSPEQASAAPKLDARSDQYSLACVVYEMLAGEPPFRGRTAQAIVAKVLTEKPERLVAHRALLPPHIEAAVLTAMAKLPADRFAGMREFQDALERSDGKRTHLASAVLRRVRQPVVPWVLVALLAVLLGLLSARFVHTRASPGPVMRLAIRFPPSLQAGLGMAVSPDGRIIILEAGRGLYVRRMDALEPTPISGTEEGNNPFFSPDGKWIGFTTGQKLKKVPLDGGTPIVLADAFAGSGTWGDDGTIIYRPSNASFAGGLWRVSAGGGTPTPLTTPDTSRQEQGHYWPQMLPGSKAVLFTAVSTSSRARIDVLSLASGERKTIVADGSYARYVASGHILFVRSGVVLVAPFDPVRLEVTGEPSPILEDVAVGGDATQGGYAASDNGLLVYIPTSQWQNQQLTWVDRDGHEEPVLDSLADYHLPRLSPDGRRIALAIGYPEPDIWIYEIQRRALNRLTRRQEGSATAPLWTTDGSRVIYSGQAPAYDLFWRSASGSSSEQKLLASPENKWATSISPDGRTVAFGTNDLWLLHLGPRPTAEALTHTPYVEGAPAWSPDGRWLAYNSNESGRFETYVGPASDPIGERRQVSTGGGTYVRWGADARELFYFSNFSDGRMMSAPFDPATGVVGTPKQLFQGPYENGVYSAPGYDVTRDGRRFLMVKTAIAAGQREVRVIVNWPEALKARAQR
jgi:serine/threonine-protein kinase